MAYVPLGDSKSIIAIDPDDLCDDIKVTTKPIEDEPHLTLAMTIPPNSDLTVLQNLCNWTPPVTISVKGLGCFSNQDKKFEDGSLHSYDVLYLEPEVGEHLLKLHTSIHNAYNIRWQFPSFVPHITLAYLKHGRAQKYIDAFANLSDKPQFECNSLVLRKYKVRDSSIIFGLGQRQFVAN